MLQLAEESKDTALLLEANYALGDTLFWAGDFENSLQHLDRSLEMYDRPKHHSLAFVYGGYDPAVASLAFAAWDLWMLGYPEQAVERSNKSVALADSLHHPFSQSIAYSFAAMLHHARHDPVATRRVRASRRWLFAPSMGSPYFWRWVRSCWGGRTIRRTKTEKAST